MSKKRSIRLGLITFAISLIITTMLAMAFLSNTSRIRRERATFIAESIANRIHAEIKNREYITRILEIEVMSSDGELTQDAFQKIGEALFDDNIDVVDMTLAPNGVINYVYPMNSGVSERVNLFEDSQNKVHVDNSKNAGVGIIMTPVKLLNDTYGIIIRRPIYLGNEKSSDSFWGFASVTINLSDFLSGVNIKGIAEEGYEYKLKGTDVVTGKTQIIMEYSERELAAPVEAMISTVGGSYWTLSISPFGNWMELYEAAGVLIIVIIISILLAMLVAAYASLQATAKELEVLSYRDELTNLYNPRSYQDHMEELSKKKLPYGLIYIDLNDFKQVNDNYGHDTGNALLNIVAKRLQNSIREKDRAFRVGGDEFVVVIHGTQDRKFYESVIARMRENVAREVTIGEIELKASISAGYARCPEDGTKFEDVVKKADEAMYYNKRLLKAKRLAGQEKGRMTARDFR